jgi:hypothetical protein
MVRGKGAIYSVTRVALASASVARHLLYQHDERSHEENVITMRQKRNDTLADCG